MAEWLRPRMHEVGPHAVKNLQGVKYLAGDAGLVSPTVRKIGIQAASVSVSGTIFSTSDPLRIGGDWSGEMFTGLIDNVRVYNTALTAAQIQADMNTALTGGSAPAAAVLSAGTTAVSGPAPAGATSSPAPCAPPRSRAGSSKSV